MSFLNTAHTSRLRDTSTPGRMRQVVVPPAAGALSTLFHVD